MLRTALLLPGPRPVASFKMAEIGALCKELLRLYARGDLPATSVQKLAAAAWADGWGRGDELAESLKSAGQDGTHKGNITRDVVDAARAAGLMSSSAVPYMVELPRGAGQLAVFLPHEVLFHEAAKLGDQVLLAPDALTSPLGQLLREWAAHPDVQAGDWSQVGVVGLHCDGVQYTSTIRAGGGRSILVCSFNILTGRTPAAKHRRHTIFTLRKSRLCACGCQGYHTLQVLFDVIAWSMQCSLAGVAPQARHDGSAWTMMDVQNRLPRGVDLPRFAVLQIRGDWEFLVQAFRFRSYNSQAFCWMCNATTSGEHSYLNMADDAPHRATLMDHSAYLRGCAIDGVQPSNLFRCPGLELRHVGVDSMHAGDLGVFQDIIGGLFSLEIGHRAWHRNKKLGLQYLNEQLGMYYGANPQLTRLTPLALSQLYSSTGEAVTFPTLRAKAAQTRHAADFAHVLAVRHRDGFAGRPPFRFRAGHRLAGQEHEHLRLLVDMCRGMAQYHLECSRNPFAPAACRAAMMLCLQSLTRLNQLWRIGLALDRQASQPFKMRRKAHMLQHLVRDQLCLWGSPAESWCYADEDFIGAVKTIAARTRHPATLERRISEKLMLLSGIDG